MNIGLPNITATTPSAQLQQLQSYLFRVVEQLNWALSTIEKSINEGAVSNSIEMPSSQAMTDEEAISTFNDIKGLIIKSADIVKAYYEEIDSLLKLSGEYVAEAAFPDGSAAFIEKTNVDIGANSKNISALFTDAQTIKSDIKAVTDVLETDESGTKIIGANAWVNVGILEYDENGYPIYGMEIGQTNSENGEEISTRFAQYRSDGVHLYDQNGTEVAWIANNKLRITYAELTGRATLGEFIIDIPRGFTVKWIGGGN